MWNDIYISNMWPKRDTCNVLIFRFVAIIYKQKKYNKSAIGEMKTKSANLLPFSLNLAHQVNKESKNKNYFRSYTLKTTYQSIHAQQHQQNLEERKKNTTYTETTNPRVL